jgi:hypothetical protein
MGMVQNVDAEKMAVDDSFASPLLEASIVVIDGRERIRIHRTQLGVSLIVWSDSGLSKTTVKIDAAQAIALGYRIVREGRRVFRWLRDGGEAVHGNSQSNSDMNP